MWVVKAVENTLVDSRELILEEKGRRNLSSRYFTVKDAACDPDTNIAAGNPLKSRLDF